jgi:hypothetical protein
MFSLSSLTRPQRLLLAFGSVTALSGVVHGLVWLAVGMPSLIGPVTWRKPIVFGLSIAVLSWSLVWVVRFLRDDGWLYRQTLWLVGLLTAELLFIDMQQWRGAGSHFNTATAFDGAVFNVMGLLIVAAALILGWWTRRLFTHPRLDLPREQLAAARAGMLLLAAGNVLGVVLVTWGNIMIVRTGAVASTMGAAGNLKLTHAIALHGLQVLPVVGIVLGCVAGESRRLSALRTAAIGYTLLLAWALVQAASGRAPTDVTWPSSMLLFTALALLAAPALAVLRAVLSGHLSPRRLEGES